MRAHQGATLDFGDLQSTKGFGAVKAYGRSKLCNILFTRELAADADDRGGDVAVAIDHKIGDVANLVLGRIINIRLIDVGGEPMARRKRRRRIGHDRASGRWFPGIVVSAKARPLAKARTEADKATRL
jgi:hypothetical protein